MRRNDLPEQITGSSHHELDPMLDDVLCWSFARHMYQPLETRDLYVSACAPSSSLCGSAVAGQRRPCDHCVQLHVLSNLLHELEIRQGRLILLRHESLAGRDLFDDQLRLLVVLNRCYQ